jgi:hypothetical protein
MAQRMKIPEEVETELFTKSGRRCAICFALEGDAAVKPGQIAHLDRDPSNNKFENLCFLCQLHHDQYDSRTSQTKGLTEPEVRSYREKLYAEWPRSLSATPKQGGNVDVSGNISAGSGEHSPGGDARIEGGTGRHGASGGNVRIGPGTYKAGDGGASKGGDLIIKGGDSE